MYFGGQIKPEFPVWSTHKPSIEPHQHYPSLAQADSKRPFTPALQSLVKIRSPSLQTTGFWAGLGSQWEARACMATADAAIALHPPWQESSAGREVVDEWDESQCHPNRADTIYEQVILIKAGAIDSDKGEKEACWQRKDNPSVVGTQIIFISGISLWLRYIPSWRRQFGLWWRVSFPHFDHIPAKWQDFPTLVCIFPAH